MQFKQIETEVFYLKMTQQPSNPFSLIPNAYFLKMKKPMKTEEYLNCYTKVGEKYNWVDRLLISEEQLSDNINKPNTDIYILCLNQCKAGFAELVRYPDYTEILYFGLFPEFIGKGMGNQFLRMVIDAAWRNQPRWIQLNTCKLDHPNALNIYQKAGFGIYKTTLEKRNFKN